MTNDLRVAANYQPVLRELGLDAQSVFTHPQIKVWRSIPERENCTLDGAGLRLHIKRYHAQSRRPTPADREAQGIRLLAERQIPTLELVAWGTIDDGRSFVITRDLAGCVAADKLIEAGLDFSAILNATADLAARLHNQALHHRDLYLCHFFVNQSDPSQEIRLIDAARVRQLPRWPLRQRWIIKDLAQFWYSMLQLPIPAEQRAMWFDRYTQQRCLRNAAGLLTRVQRKARRIARHDVHLNARQPQRNISIP